MLLTGFADTVLTKAVLLDFLNREIALLTLLAVPAAFWVVALHEAAPLASAASMAAIMLLQFVPVEP